MSLQFKGNVINGFNLTVKSTNYSRFSAPIMISIDVTNKCNYKCLHCFNESDALGRSNELSDSEILEVAKQVRDFNPLMVCLCGGETLCRKNLIDIIKVLRENVPLVSMVSNGYFISKEKAIELKDAGICFIQISLDGIDKYQHDTFRGFNGAYERAISAIKNIKSVGIHVATSLVPNKLMIHDVQKYFDTCVDLGVNEVRIMPFLPMGRGSKYGEKLILNSNEYAFLQNLIIKNKYKYGDKVSITWGDPIDHLIRMPNNLKIGLSTYNIEIKSNGDIGITPYFPITFGNIKKHTLKEYWNNGLDTIWSNELLQNEITKVKFINDFARVFQPIKIDICEVS